MGRRRQRHFNPATAGCAAVFDGRFGISSAYVNPPGNYVTTWEGRSNSLHSAAGIDGVTPIDRKKLINGQGACEAETLNPFYVGQNPFSSGPSAGISLQTQNCSVFICAKNDGTQNYAEYARILGVAPDCSAYYGMKQPSYPTPATSHVASFFGDAVATWNDLNDNSPNVSADDPFAACFSNNGTSCTPIANNTAQSDKTVTAVSCNVAYLFGTVISGVYMTQEFRGSVAMIAIATAKLSTPVERRILQMMGRVWRIHTL
jgi:hypothetical protein